MKKLNKRAIRDKLDFYANQWLIMQAEFFKKQKNKTKNKWLSGIFDDCEQRARKYVVFR